MSFSRKTHYFYGHGFKSYVTVITRGYPLGDGMDIFRTFAQTAGAEHGWCHGHHGHWAMGRGANSVRHRHHKRCGASKVVGPTSFQKARKKTNPKSKKKGNFQFLPSSFSPALFVSERFPYSHVRRLRFPFSFSLSSLGPQDFLPAACPDSSILVFISVRLVVFFLFFLLFVFPCI